MNAIDAIRGAAETSLFILRKYCEDLSDADLLCRPGPGCNHLAWQLGHLIASECSLLDSVAPGSAVELPEGFAAGHAQETSHVDDPAQFRTKAEYLGLLEKTHAATLAALGRMSEGDLDRPGPEAFQPMFPTVGAVLLLIAMHPLMHAGQFVPVRRALGKPVVI